MAPCASPTSLALAATPLTTWHRNQACPCREQDGRQGKGFNLWVETLIDNRLAPTKSNAVTSEMPMPPRDAEFRLVQLSMGQTRPPTEQVAGCQVSNPEGDGDLSSPPNETCDQVRVTRRFQNAMVRPESVSQARDFFGPPKRPTTGGACALALGRPQAPAQPVMSADPPQRTRSLAMTGFQWLLSALRLERSALSAAILAAFLPLAAFASSDAPRTLRVGIGLPADSIQGRAVHDFAARVQKYTEGRLRIELQAGGKLGNDLSMVKLLQEGALEMTVPDSSTLAAWVKGFSAISYPFTFLSESEADTILDGQWGTRLLEQLGSHGLVGLAYWENGFRHMTNSKRALQNVDDFQGVRMRTMQNPLLVDSFRRLGFEAVPMPFPQVYEALKSKTVDGQENPLSTILSSRFHEVQSNLTLSSHVYSAHVLLMSRKTWDQLSTVEREALQKAAIGSRDQQRRWSRDSNVSALAQLRAKGMKIAVIPSAERERIRTRLRDVFEAHNAEIGIRIMLDLYVQLGQLRMNPEKPIPSDR